MLVVAKVLVLSRGEGGGGGGACFGGGRGGEGGAGQGEEEGGLVNHFCGFFCLFLFTRSCKVKLLLGGASLGKDSNFYVCEESVVVFLPEGCIYELLYISKRLDERIGRVRLMERME